MFAAWWRWKGAFDYRVYMSLLVTRFLSTTINFNMEIKQSLLILNTAQTQH